MTEPTLAQRSRHLDRTLHRPVQRVKILQTAHHGFGYHIWDADFSEAGRTQPFGNPDGFATKTDALAWVRHQNAFDIMLKLVVVQ